MTWCMDFQGYLKRWSFVRPSVDVCSRPAGRGSVEKSTCKLLHMNACMQLHEIAKFLIFLFLRARHHRSGASARSSSLYSASNRFGCAIKFFYFFLRRQERRGQGGGGLDAPRAQLHPHGRSGGDRCETARHPCTARPSKTANIHTRGTSPWVQIT